MGLPMMHCTEPNHIQWPGIIGVVRLRHLIPTPNAWLLCYFPYSKRILNGITSPAFYSIFRYSYFYSSVIFPIPRKRVLNSFFSISFVITSLRFKHFRSMSTCIFFPSSANLVWMHSRIKQCILADAIIAPWIQKLFRVVFASNSDTKLTGNLNIFAFGAFLESFHSLIILNIFHECNG